MFSFAAVRVYCCFCFLYVLWFAIKAVSVYTCESIINGYVRAIIICFSYLLGLIFNQSGNLGITFLVRTLVVAH